MSRVARDHARSGSLYQVLGPISAEKDSRRLEDILVVRVWLSGLASLEKIPSDSAKLYKEDSDQKFPFPKMKYTRIGIHSGSNRHLDKVFI